jgi:hypothetical protein
MKNLIKELEMKVKAAETLSLQEAEDAAALDAAALAQQEKEEEEAKVNESTHEQSNIVAEETNAAVKRIQDSLYCVPKMPTALLVDRERLPLVQKQLLLGMLKAPEQQVVAHKLVQLLQLALAQQVNLVHRT